ANKPQAQKCKREKFPIDVPDGSDHSSMDIPGMKTESRKKDTAGEAHPCLIKNEFLTPVHLSQTLSSSSGLLCDTKYVRISENTPISPFDSS
ncbi:protein Spindly isoform X2, partial [Clarias magur]